MATDALGLKPGMPGPEFEAQLGRFLAWSAALPAAEAILTLGVSPPTFDPPQHIADWFRQSRSIGGQALNAIHVSLFELFGASRINDFAARTAYGKLLRYLSVQPADLIYATTNYDVAAELALDDLDFNPFWGERASVRHGRPRPLRTEGLVANKSDYTPLLHLHGRVGWYVTESSDLVSLPPDAPYNPDLGAPGLLLPDPNKTYVGIAFAEQLWREFDAAIDLADRVLVLGHSLHDTFLVQRLQAKAARDPRQVAVTYFETHDNETDSREVGRIREVIGADIHTIACSFGTDIQIDSSVVEVWQEGKTTTNAHSRLTL